MGTQNVLLYPSALYRIALMPGQTITENDIEEFIRCAHNANPWISRDVAAAIPVAANPNIYLKVLELSNGERASSVVVKTWPQYVIRPDQINAYLRYVEQMLDPDVRPQTELRFMSIDPEARFDRHLPHISG